MKLENQRNSSRTVDANVRFDTFFQRQPIIGMRDLKKFFARLLKKSGYPSHTRDSCAWLVGTGKGPANDWMRASWRTFAKVNDYEGYDL